MYAVSDAFKAALRSGSQKIATRCDILDGLVPSLLGLRISDGSASMDKRNAVRGKAKIVLDDPDGNYTPAGLRDLLAPNGNEFALHRGLHLPVTSLYPGASTFPGPDTFPAPPSPELVPLGVFGIDRVTVTESGSKSEVVLEGSDRAAEIARRKFTDTYSIASGTPIETAVHDIIDSRYPGLRYNLAITGLTTPAIAYTEGADPWACAQQLAMAAGCELFFDPNGIVVMRPEPSPTSGGVTFSYVEGVDATILDVNRVLQRAGIVNHWIVIGQGTGIATPVRAEAIDSDPTSPTWVGGKFGDIPDWVKTSLAKTTGQAQTIANAKLNSSSGLMEDVRFNAIVNPAHQPGDVVQIEVDRPGAHGLFLFDSLSIPMRQSGAMPVTTRSR